MAQIPDSDGTIDGIFGSDSTFLPIKTEMIPVNSSSGHESSPPTVKLEAFSVSELKHHLEERTKLLNTVNSEVVAIQNLLAKDVDPINAATKDQDPINTSTELNTSQNLLSNVDTKDNLVLRLLILYMALKKTLLHFLLMKKPLSLEMMTILTIQTGGLTRTDIWLT